MDFFQRQWPMFSQNEKNKIRNMKIFVGGAGGLGTHQLIQLQRIGAKKIYIVDKDKVEPSNLNRQILYGYDDIGLSKVRAARDRLKSFKMETEFEIIEGGISSDLEIPTEVDVILDALDNYHARFILDELAHKYNKPFVHGAVDSWHGQVTSIIPGCTPSLKEILGGGAISKKTEAGQPIPVFSPVVASVAIVQVIEAVKLHVKKEENLANTLMLINWEDYSLEKIEIQLD